MIQQKSEDLQEVENYGTELVNEAEAKIVKLTNELQAKESLISDLQHGGTGLCGIQGTSHPTYCIR